MLRRSAIRRKPREHKESAPWRRPKIRLDHQAWEKLKDSIYYRSHGRCENRKDDGTRCVNLFNRWNFDPHHILHRSLGGSDSVDNVLAVCVECHRDKHHKVRAHADWIAL